MESLYRKSVEGQFMAAFSTLRQCIDHCPDSLWQQPVAQHPFSQSVFHALFYADLYLGHDIDSCKSQPFHQDNRDVFGDYEQLGSDVPAGRYEKSFLGDYVNFCRDKATSVLGQTTIDQLNQVVEFPWLDITRAEMHVYNIRHIQHHAAQLILKIRLHSDFPCRWVRTGWADQN